jgi:hypothetical protein
MTACQCDGHVKMGNPHIEVLQEKRNWKENDVEFYILRCEGRRSTCLLLELTKIREC